MKIQPQNVPDEYMGRPLPVYLLDVDRPVLSVPERKVPAPQSKGEDQDDAVDRWKDQTVWSKHLIVAPVFTSQDDFVTFRERCQQAKEVAPDAKMWVEVPCDTELAKRITLWVEKQVRAVSDSEVVEMAPEDVKVQHVDTLLLMRTRNAFGGAGYYNEVVLTSADNVIQVHKGQDEPWKFKDHHLGVVSQLCWVQPKEESKVEDGTVIPLKEDSDTELERGGRLYLFRSLIVPGWIDERCHMYGAGDLPRDGPDGWRELRTQYVRRLMERREGGG